LHYTGDCLAPNSPRAYTTDDAVKGAVGRPRAREPGKA
jgi:hypothetical protein